MSHAARRVLILLAGPVGLTVTTVAPALADSYNHTEPLTAGPDRTTTRTSMSFHASGDVVGRAE